MTTTAPSRWLTAIAVLPFLVAPVLIAGPAAADDVATGQWYLDAFHLDELHDSGITGAGVTIAIMDSPINLDVPTLAGANVEVREPSRCLDDSGAPLPSRSADLDGTADARHGTDTASMVAGTGKGYEGQAGIAGVAPGAKVLYYAVSYIAAPPEPEIGCPGGPDLQTALAADIDDAIDAGADIISISLSGGGTPELSDAIARAHRAGVVVVAGVPNTTFSASGGTWPAAANGVVAVQAIDAQGQPQEDVEGGLGVATAFDFITVSGPGVGMLSQGAGGADWQGQAVLSGTSFATPAVAGFLALVLQKYPDATGNQLIQTLIRNTGVDDHELVHDDSIGYGIASATHMLANDPAQYPDVNPLLVDGENLPSVADSTATAAPTGAPTEPVEAATSVPWVPIIVGAIVGLILLAGIVVLIIILATRRSRSSAGPR